MNLESYEISNEVLKLPEPKPEYEIISNWQGDISTPLVSIVCHTYNHVNYIKDALDSFLMQETQFPFEIIIHDDASNDGTAEIVKTYSEAYPNIIVPIMQATNQWSLGIKPSSITFPRIKGEFLAFCEGDDYWISPNKLSTQVFSMQKYPNIGISFHPAYRIDVNNNQIIEDFKKGNLEQVFPVVEAVESRNQFAPTASYLLRFNENLSLPDWFFTSKDLPFGDYFIETIMGRKGLLYLPDLRSVYRRNVEGSYTDQTNKLSASHLANRMKAVIKYTNKLKTYPEISSSSIDNRKQAVILDYQTMAITRESFDMLRLINIISKNSKIKTNPLNSLLLSNKIIFLMYIKSKKSTSKLKSKIKSFI